MRKLHLALAGFLILVGCGQPTSISKTSPASSPISSPAIPDSIATSQFTDEQSTPSADGCLPPLITFAYPNGEVPNSRPQQKSVLPPSDWSLESPLPNYEKLSAYRLALISYSDQYSEIWVLTNNRQGLFRYRTDTKEWSINRTTYESIASDLFLDHEGNVWAARSGYDGPGDTQPFLSRYDEEKGAFIPVYNNGDTWTLTVSSVKVDETGIFWLMANNRGVYQLMSYNPSTLEMKIRLKDPDYGYSIEISPGNKILIIDKTERDLLFYSPDTDKIESYDIPFATNISRGARLHLDRFGRLWFDDSGWVDLSNSAPNQWYTVVRSPIFINMPEGLGRWGWASPTFETESADGLLWFSSSRGNGWLDTNTGTWCVFTTYSSNILQDRQHNLWMLADGKLFRRTENP